MHRAATEVQEAGEGGAMHVVPATQVGVEGHKVPLVLVRQADLEDKETNLAVPSQLVSHHAEDDKVIDVSQEVNPLDTVTVGPGPVANLLVGEDMCLGDVVHHRTVEADREHDQVSPLVVEALGPEVSLLVVVSEGLLLVNTL